MPIAFDSLSHGQIVFGFYNIETDALLLNEQFFFCTDFCAALRAVKTAPARANLPGHVFARQEDIGDLMGAIHGVRHTGYLGELYTLWPFPTDPAGFRQKLYGAQNRKQALEVLARHARPAEITLEHLEDGGAKIGPYHFSQDQFTELLGYVKRGGMPTWEGFEDGRRPDYVSVMLDDYGL